MKAANTQKQLKKCHNHHKKSIKKNSITQAKTNAPISQTPSEDLKLTIQTYQMKNKELKKKLGQRQ